MKQCTKCKITYPESNFHKDRTHKDNLSSVCKDCRREYNIYYRQQRLKHGLCYDCGKTRPEGYIRFCLDCLKKREKLNKIYEQQRKTKGLCRQCASVYYFTHRKERLEYQKKYNRENRGEIRRYKQDYYLKHILETQDIDAILERAKSIYSTLREEFIIGELERCLGEKQS